MSDSLFDAGIAIGNSDIVRDVVIYRFRDEVFEVPTMVAMTLRWLDAGDNPPYGYNGFFYTAPVEKLRELKAQSYTPEPTD